MSIQLDSDHNLLFFSIFKLIGHFRVMGGSEAEGDLALIQKINLFLCLLVFFKNNFHNKAKKVCIKTRSPTPSLPSITVKWPIELY